MKYKIYTVTDGVTITVTEAETRELNVKTTSPDSSGTAQYRSNIRAAVRGLWSGAIDFDGFWDAMSSAINLGLTGAWRAGMADCGVSFDDITPQESAALMQRIIYEHQWINGYANAIEQGSRANGGKLTPLYNRAEVWIGRWEGVRTEARVMACANKPLKWVVGPTEHCSSCLKLDGKVKRASFWDDSGILPRIHGAPYLKCRGFRCQCQLVVTDEPLSRGPLPGLP